MLNFRTIISLQLFLLSVALRAADFVTDTIPASAVRAYPVMGNISPSDSISQEKIRSSASIADAVRMFSGVQVKDYGGVGGLKTVNIRSLGSQHTGVFLDGIQVDNAQNMQVDLGRLAVDDVGSIRVFNSNKTEWLQSAKEYASANAIYIDVREPVFVGRKSLLRSKIRGGSFALLSGSLVWEKKIAPRLSLRLSNELVHSDGRYRFRVTDFREMPGGKISGYDTVMVRTNCDLRSYRIEGQLFGKSADGASEWSLRLYDYDSERGLPGPVYKIAGSFPMSVDRQADNNFFVQGKWSRRFSGKNALAIKAKYASDRLHYIDFSELDASVPPADYIYKNSSLYISFSGLLSPMPWWKLGLAADYQFNRLKHNKLVPVSPERHSIYAAGSSAFVFPKIKISSSLLYTIVDDVFNGKNRINSCLTPALTARYRPFDRIDLNITGFAKRSFRMPTFNDLYYVTAGVKALRPEDARQTDLGLDYSFSPLRGLSIVLGMEGYHNALNDKIIAVPTSNQFRWSMYNIGKVEILGLLMKADLEYNDGSHKTGITLRYSYQKALDISEPDAISYKGQIPYIPLHSGTVSLFYSQRGWRADADFFFTGERYTASSNLPVFRLKPWGTGDMSLSKSFGIKSSELKATINLRNLFGSRYEIVANYPMPGMNFLIGIEYIF